MPKYRFNCECGLEKALYVPLTTESVPCDCGKPMVRALPNLAGQEVRETVDKLTNRKWKQDQTAIINQRREDHYWEVEVPRLVQQYSVETCLEQGWLVYNDKGELVINKPPSKR